MKNEPVDPEPKDKVNLFKLPKWQQYGIALTVVATVVALALVTRGDKPAAPWITQRLIPILGWIYLVLLAFSILRFVFGKIRQRR